MKEVINNQKITVNMHLTKRCNYKCRFCYCHFSESNNELSINNNKIIIDKLINHFKDYELKINFVGGEPFLYNKLSELLVYTKNCGAKTSIVTNASLIKKDWVYEYGKNLDILGISLNSLNKDTLKKLGCGNNNDSINKIIEIFKVIDEFNKINHCKILKKLNTVVCRLNYNEDMKDFIRLINVDRWKILKILLITNDNKENASFLNITEEEFRLFYERHKALKYDGVNIVCENNEEMEKSYLMVSPDGRFFDNSGYEYKYSDPILEVGVEKALNQIEFDYEKFLRRCGNY